VSIRGVAGGLELHRRRLKCSSSWACAAVVLYLLLTLLLARYHIADHQQSIIVAQSYHILLLPILLQLHLQKHNRLKLILIHQNSHSRRSHVVCVWKPHQRANAIPCKSIPSISPCSHASSLRNQFNNTASLCDLPLSLLTEPSRTHNQWYLGDSAFA